MKKQSANQNNNAIGHAGLKELIAWALYDFANSGYTTVVQTTIFSTYFVGVVAGGAQGVSPGLATLLWSLSVGVANFMVMISAPVVGAIADDGACRNAFCCFHPLAVLSPRRCWRWRARRKYLGMCCPLSAPVGLITLMRFLRIVRRKGGYRKGMGQWGRTLNFRIYGQGVDNRGGKL